MIARELLVLSEQCDVHAFREAGLRKMPYARLAKEGSKVHHVDINSGSKAQSGKRGGYDLGLGFVHRAGNLFIFTDTHGLNSVFDRVVLCPDQVGSITFLATATRAGAVHRGFDDVSSIELFTEGILTSVEGLLWAARGESDVDNIERLLEEFPRPPEPDPAPIVVPTNSRYWVVDFTAPHTRIDELVATAQEHLKDGGLLEPKDLAADLWRASGRSDLAFLIALAMAERESTGSEFRRHWFRYQAPSGFIASLTSARDMGWSVPRRTRRRRFQDR